MPTISEKSKKICRAIVTIVSVISGIVTIVGGVRSVIGVLPIVQLVNITIPVYGWIVFGIFLISIVCVFFVAQRKCSRVSW